MLRRQPVVSTSCLLKGKLEVANASTICFQCLKEHHMFDSTVSRLSPGTSGDFRKLISSCWVGYCMRSLEARKSQCTVLSQEHMWAMLPKKFKILFNRLSNYLKRSLKVWPPLSSCRKMRIPLVLETGSGIQCSKDRPATSRLSDTFGLGLQRLLNAFAFLLLPLSHSFAFQRERFLRLSFFTMSLEFSSCFCCN